MTDENIHLLSKNAILLHKLPSEYIQEALDHFPCECIYRHIHNDKGLQIYFLKVEQAVKYAHMSGIEIKGQLFKISFAVTYLTVHEIPKFISDDHMLALVESNGYKNFVCLYARPYINVVDSSITDYCIILKIPEILYHDPLKSILWPEAERSFKVSFFCRLCRGNGHKSSDCTKLERDTFKSSKKIYPPDSKDLYPGPFNINVGSGTQINDLNVFIGNNYQSASLDEGYTSSTSCSPLKSKLKPNKMSKIFKPTGKSNLIISFQKTTIKSFTLVSVV